ncbi:hypothetical protein [Mumia zhuanghuii]|uniref:DUF3040 domain-containing protein n=1 Tax=Mumia zhuanghuii TaxID=2585211 RepID=A0A5C4LVX5_9ACTN|nr:hypothetical protein [Mumia zhuanghuii]TNC23332.1 hypothetical protein FHE65_35585 [Mumia zhuanghuii]TNC41617.1 hypothetical protein FHE65_22335 [Mumia zhuanghuii]
MSGATSDDEEFERIVAGLELSFPDPDDDPPVPDADPPPPLTPAQGVFQPRWSDRLSHEEDEDESAWDTSDFVPPQPEPLPPGDRWTRAAWAGLIGGPALLFVLAVVGAPVPGVIPGAAVVAFVVALVVLLVRRGDHDRGDDPDHGAVI